MENNRLYIVDTSTKEYILIAKHFTAWYQWEMILDEFLQSRLEDGQSQTKLILIDEHSPEWSKWIKHGINYAEKKQ